MNTPTITEIQALERRWMQAWVERDLTTCAALLADDFILTSARGVLMPKQAWLDNAAGPFRCTAFEWLEIIVRPFDDMAVVHGRSRQQASVGEQDWSGLFLLTDVWARRADGWKVVARHGTGPIAE
ncbi:MAG TPA: nuclear transport factor 2 family protein [Burkholderiaceae bacterium]